MEIAKTFRKIFQKMKGNGSTDKKAKDENAKKLKMRKRIEKIQKWKMKNKKNVSEKCQKLYVFNAFRICWLCKFG